MRSEDAGPFGRGGWAGHGPGWAGARPPWMAMAAAPGHGMGPDDERGQRGGPFGDPRSGGPGFGFAGFGPGGWGGQGRGGRGRGGRARRGDVRAAVLLLLAETPRNGYQIIQELGERSGGAWKPSPGSVYPVLQQLEDEGLVVSTAADVGRSYRITDAGTAYVEANRTGMGVPWEDAANSFGAPAMELAQQIPQVIGAIKQVLQAGNDRQVTQASAVLAETRRALYRILAEDAAPTAPTVDGDPEGSDTTG